jgi:hypothetical protein
MNGVGATLIEPGETFVEMLNGMVTAVRLGVPLDQRLIHPLITVDTDPEPRALPPLEAGHVIYLTVGTEDG